MCWRDDIVSSRWCSFCNSQYYGDLGHRNCPARKPVTKPIQKPQDKTYVVCAMHRIAQDWIRHTGLKRDECVTIVSARGLRGLSANTPIIVVDTYCKFEDSRSLNEALARFTSVRHVTL